MHPTNLDGVDLNLLRVLDALLAERHVTRAAQRLGLSQPATSHALARLRTLLRDPLFVRTPRGLEPTARAAALAVPLREALGTLAAVVSGDGAFTPATTKRTFTLASTDYGTFMLVQPLLARVRETAPRVDLWMRPMRDDAWDQLALGDVDLAVGPLVNLPPRASLHRKVLYKERFVCVVRRDHPIVKKRLDLDTFLAVSHLLVAPRGKPGGVVDTALAERGLSRRVALAVPHFLAAPHLVASSDLVLAVGARVAAAFSAMLPLKVFDPPLPVPGFDVGMAWHERTHHDAAHRWLRAEVTAAERAARDA